MTFERRVCTTIANIPRGKVATYGQIAALAGSPCAAQSVGMILRRSSQDIPWQRVINKEGRISIVNMEYPAEIQAELLKQEGVEIAQKNNQYFVDLEHFLWQA